MPFPPAPGEGPYDVVWTTTSRVTVPEMLDPDLVTLLVTSVPMYVGTEAGGAPLLPGSAVKVPPHRGGLPGAVAKPLKALGAAPPLSELAESHWAPKNVTVAPVVALRSPTAKPPRLGKA